jgi:hypothetical protein
MCHVIIEELHEGRHIKTGICKNIAIALKNALRMPQADSHLLQLVVARVYCG